ncbi:extracellular solute-binding protein [Treponema sp. OttesenSCG-928-L16]|nr:extracellular solute-binding protein [Treponema sp. OttesenSCG-928-L16]
MVHESIRSFGKRLMLFLLLLIPFILFAGGTEEKETTLTILSHAVHQNVARGNIAGVTGGDIVGEWAQRNNVKIEWITAGIDPVHDRLFRELALRETSIDIAFIIDKYVEPRLTSLLEPLDAYLNQNPIEKFEEIPPNLLSPTRYNGHLIAVPYRHSLGGLHWNEVLFKERGLTRPPVTAAEMMEYAQRLTYTRDNGTEVVGLVANFGEGYGSMYGFLRLFGADLFKIDSNDKVVIAANTPEMITGLKNLRHLYTAGAVPVNFATIGIDEQGAMVTGGRAAMSFGPFARYTVFNNPEVSQFPGSINVTKHVDIEPGKPSQQAMEIWSMAIPKNSKNKELAWDLIRELSTIENTVRAALNGNSPVRPSAYSDQRVMKVFPWKKDEAEALLSATVLPKFKDSLQAWLIFQEEGQAAVIGTKTPEQAAASMQSRLEKLLH